MNKTGLQQMEKSYKCAEVASSNCRPVVERTSVVLSTRAIARLHVRCTGLISDRIYDNYACLFVYVDHCERSIVQLNCPLESLLSLH